RRRPPLPKWSSPQPAPRTEPPTARTTPADRPNGGQPMHQCHKCGREIAVEAGVRRNVQTGTQEGGRPFFRTVTYCPRCEGQRQEEQDARALNHRRLALAGLVFAAGAIGYFVLVYLGKVTPPW